MNQASLSAPINVDRLSLYGLCVVVSTALFLLFCYIDDIINDDGINYIYAAYEYINGNTVGALAFRPELTFYGQFALLSEYTGLSLNHAAYSLSLLSQIALMCGFLAVTRALGASTSVQILAIVVMASMSSLNHLRPHIIKGFGFWASQLWALWAIIEYTHSKRWRYLLLWLGFSVAAISFRIEAVVYIVGIALLAPIVLTGAARKRFAVFALVILCCALVLGLLGRFYFAPVNNDTDNPPDYAAYNDVNNNTYNNVFSPTLRFAQELDRARQLQEGITRQKTLIRASMPNKWAEKATSDMIIGGLLFHVAITLLDTTNILFLILVVLFATVRPLPRTADVKLIAGYFSIGILIALYTVASRFFVDSRYVFMPALLLCIPLPFWLDRLWFHTRGSHRATALARAAIIIIPVLSIVEPVIRDGNDKAYIVSAGSWIRKHVPPSSRVYYNDQKLAFYGGDYSNQSFRIPGESLTELSHQNYQYVVIHTDKVGLTPRLVSVDSESKLELAHSDVGPKNTRVDIYKVLKPPG